MTIVHKVDNVVNFSTAKTEDEIDHDQYKFAVGMKYDLSTRNLTFKKVKYISDELFNDLQWRKRGSMEF